MEAGREKGVLLESPARPDKPQRNSVLLTLDLTRAVVDEAIRRRDSLIVAYHPIIFRGLKEITLGNSQQESLLRLAQEGISVYSPHTAVDAVTGGLGDWMVDIVTSPFRGRPGFTFEASVLSPSIVTLQGFEGAGIGRAVKFSQEVNLADLLEAIGRRLGMEYLQLALPSHLQAQPHDTIPLSSIAMCAGSGWPIIRSLPVNVLFTGELSHHDALAAIEAGKIVIATWHSNSERGFLSEVMGPRLREVVEERWRAEVGGKEAEWGGEVEVGISKVDRDPYQVVRVGR
ncbi:hypothetical protein FGG08_002389 [Glutinoglossum americanum]|uniref:Uncharacterized protein n=1 Tax=Glutinoglossum americanum TaxID=1670608 RepID=A0A9P8I9T8_9PEZI|nr:hypothetical protein FGG08_002389 [Glutinoglossum americanum]